MQKNKDEQIEKMKCEISHIINDNMYHLLDEDDCNYLAENLYEQGYRKQSEGEWIIKGLANPKCSACNSYNRCGDKSNFCPNCGARMKDGE